jgi:predicted flavoprotein YhiN
MLIRIPVCIVCAAMMSGCGSPAGPTPSTPSTPPTIPTSPTPPVECSSTIITIGRLSNGSAPSPGQGMEWASYFQTTVLPARSAVYFVDINFEPAGCIKSWTVVSADMSAVQLSPRSGAGPSKVELFMPANTGVQRSTMVTIAEQSVSITQAGG